MAKKIAVDCGDNTSLEQLFKLAIRNVECGEALTCDNHNLSWQQLLRQCFVVDEDTGEVSLNVCGCEGGGGGILAVTYDELVELIDGGELVAGSWYLLTDFRTVHYFTDGQTTLEDINTGELEPLLLLATSDSTVDSRVFSPSFPTDVIHYDWDAANWLNDMSFSADQATIVPGWKGIITYRWDTRQDNSTGYDFRNVKFRRWAIDEAGSEFDDLYYSWNSTDCNGLGVDALDYDDFYTWQDYDPLRCFGNHITSIMGIIEGGVIHMRLNNIIFHGLESICAFNSFNAGCGLMTFGSNCNGNTFGTGCSGNAFGTGCYGNAFSTGCNGNTFGTDCAVNAFGTGCVENTFGGGCTGNAFGTDCSGNAFGGGCYLNTFGTGCSDNTFITNCVANTFSTGCMENTFGGGCTGNAFGTECGGNAFGAACNGNTFGTDCAGNTFGTGCSGNAFGTGCSGNTFGADAALNELHIGVSSTDFTAEPLMSASYTKEIKICSDYTVLIEYIDCSGENPVVTLQEVTPPELP